MEAMRTRAGTPVRSEILALARIVRLLGTAVAAVLVVGILLVVLDADPSIGIVETITDAARWLADPFAGLFDLDSKDGQTAANWGLAAVVYFAISRVVVRLLCR